MDVQEILKKSVRESIGIYTPTDEDNGVFLDFLNRAHNELYKFLLDFNTNVPLAYLTKDSVAGELKLDTNPYQVLSVYSVDDTKNLKIISPLELFTRHPAQDEVTPPKYWYLAPSSAEQDRGKRSIYIYPKKNTSLKVCLRPQFRPLKIDDVSIVIPYDETDHDVLIDGTVYYSLMSEPTLKDTNKALEYKNNWNSGKLKLLNKFRAAYQKTNTSPVD